MRTLRSRAGLRTVLRTAAVTFAAAAAVAVTAVTGPVAAADTPVIPDFTDGQGLTRVTTATEVRSSTDFTLTVTTPELSGQHKIRVFLPSDYYSAPDKRWPVTYFLHGGAGNVNDAAAAPALHDDRMITVVPDGGLKGWYANWKMQNTALGAANWENFHLRQVVPFVDANLRTVADRDHRAVVGLSMGGFGALHYAQARPDLFGHVASLSGGIDFGLWEIRGVVLATELNLPNALCTASTSGSGTGCADYGPVVDSDAIFGSPYALFDDRIWNAVDPASPANLSKLADTGVALYTGDRGLIDSRTAVATRNVRNRLDQLGIPSRYVDYGDGSSLSPQCNGEHNYGCWSAAFADYIPRLADAFAQAG
ncbi:MULTISPECIES: alpha/beta hydrolase-fold protein [unclassified Streptomyces]|uniref:alpha/beta hydrolase n=1 Tax=unclassified Streptomyces TaxID=2593676 RepID=UPI0006FF1B9E|nr:MULTISPECIES: alpha/beta hydrolase-fold protein [unclassified Streptomyces]KQX56283.1 esterase [Streptomyces sp. Root1304]KRA97098.1 esterase [Streptomyces sp. Root66D1]